MKALYPALEPYASHLVQRGRHLLHVEECGRQDGLPVLFLHGGPGSGCKPYHRSFFDPDRYRIVLPDQRGAGRSLPQGECLDNATADLIDDLEHIRRLLGVEGWLLFGGSWGATLALAYAQQFPERVQGLVLRGAFLGRRRDLDWFIGPEGVRKFYPDRWDECAEVLSGPEHDEPVPALYRRLTGEDELVQRRAARCWSYWSEQVLLGEAFKPESFSEHVSAGQVSQARLELYYAVNDYFLPERGLLERCGRIAHLPTILIHGRRDWVCPVEGSYSLHRRLPASELRIVESAGHLASEQAMVDALVTATDEMAERLSR
jgi:proline iminopeptidase